MPSFKLPLAAAFLGAAAFAMPAAAQQMVHHQETVVTTHTETHPDHPSGQSVVDVPVDGAPPPVRIQLAASGTVVGTALDESGAAIASGRVVAMGPGGARTGDLQADGSFAIRGLAAGSYSVRLMASPQGGSQQPRIASRTVGIAAGEETRIEIRLAPGPMVSGHVTRGGAAVAGTTVMLMSADGPGGAPPTDTADDGAFQFKDVQPGDYQVRSANAVAKIKVLDANVNVDLVIPTGSVAGRVTDAQTGEPIDGATVLLYVPAATAATSLVPSPMDQVFGRSQSHADGAFAMEDVDPGTYSLRVSAQGFATTRRDGVAVAAGGSPNAVSVALDEGGTVAGRVVDTAGRPVPGARVMTQNLSLGIADFRPPALSGEDGSFTVHSLGAGTYAFIAMADDRPGTTTTVVFDGTALHVELRVPVGGALLVRVVDASGAPVPEAKISFGTTPPGSGPIMPISTDQDGLARFAHVVAGTYAGTARLARGGSAAFSATVSEGSPAEARAVLPGDSQPPPSHGAPDR